MASICSIAVPMPLRFYCIILHWTLWFCIGFSPSWALALPSRLSPSCPLLYSLGALLWLTSTTYFWSLSQSWPYRPVDLWTLSQLWAPGSTRPSAPLRLQSPLGFSYLGPWPCQGFSLFCLLRKCNVSLWKFCEFWPGFACYTDLLFLYIWDESPAKQKACADQASQLLKECVTGG